MVKAISGYRTPNIEAWTQPYWRRGGVTSSTPHPPPDGSAERRESGEGKKGREEKEWKGDGEGREGKAEPPNKNAGYGPGMARRPLVRCFGHLWRCSCLLTCALKRSYLPTGQRLTWRYCGRQRVSYHASTWRSLIGWGEMSKQTTQLTTSYVCD